MLSWQGLILFGMFSILIYIIAEGLVQMYKESKALKDDKNANDELYLARMFKVLDE